MAKLIESVNVERDYGTTGTNAIVEAGNGKRYLIQDGFGGTGSLQGGAVRWEHGLVIELQPGDTLASLAVGEWNETASLWDAVIRGYDDSRPVLEGMSPISLAKSAGLA
jgi:hypothetical protein